jgi:hypothetical protein
LELEELVEAGAPTYETREEAEAAARRLQLVKEVA